MPITFKSQAAVFDGSGKKLSAADSDVPFSEVHGQAHSLLVAELAPGADNACGSCNATAQEMGLWPMLLPACTQV